MADAIRLLGREAPSVLGRPLTETETERFSRYLDLLIEWQRVHRLVGSTDPAWIVESLFLDSLLFLRVLPGSFESLLDVGSGAGIPGIPVKIVRPAVRVTLLESRRRRASFLRTAVRELRLESVTIAEERLEDLALRHRRSFDAAVMRSMGSYDRLVSIVSPLVKSSGLVVASGPPGKRPIQRGQWVEVAGASPGKSRLFAVTEVA